MLTNNIIVVDSYFNLTNKSNLIDRLQYDLVRFFDNLIVAYFFGPLCISNHRHTCWVSAQQFSH